MARKKNFDNIVDESFEEGYRSEPESSSAMPPKSAAKEPKEETPSLPKLSEKEQLLQKIMSGDEMTLKTIWEREDRSTYYLEDLHRACIDIMAHEEGMKKNEIVVNALNQYFSSQVREAAKDRVVSMAIKKLKREIKEEKR